MDESETQKIYICRTAHLIDYDNRVVLMQFLTKHLRDTNVVKEGSDGSRINLDILSDDMVRIIYNYISDTLVKSDIK